MLVFLIGMPGVGKTTVAQEVAQRLNYSFIDLDSEIEQLAGERIPIIFESMGEEHFRQLERQVLHDTVSKENTVVACGGGTPCFFDNMEVMLKAGTVIYLSDQLENIAARLFRDGGRPLVKKDDISALQTLFEAREPAYNRANVSIENASVRQAVEEITSFLETQKGYSSR